MNREILEIVVRQDVKLLTEAIALSAKRGLKTYGLSDMLVKLTLWLKSGRDDFKEWAQLCQQTETEWNTWYARYKGETE